MKIASLLVSLSMFAMAPIALAGEHPSEHPKEHPKAAPKSEAKAEEKSSEKAKDKTKGKKEKGTKESDAAKDKGASLWNREKVEQDLVSFINGQSSKSGGKYTVSDELAKTTRAMSLAKIHSDKIMQMEDGTSFVCADFKDANGETVDLDFFMKPTEGGAVDEVTRVQIHKVNGKERYTYFLQNGQWLQKTL
jgi:hypothetical protein